MSLFTTMLPQLNVPKAAPEGAAEGLPTPITEDTPEPEPRLEIAFRSPSPAERQALAAREQAVGHRAQAALLRGFLSPETQPAPRQEATLDRIPVGYDEFRRKLESGGNRNAKATTSSALGADQFLSATWLRTVEQAKPEWARGLTKDQLLEARRDPVKSGEMALHLSSQNARILRAGGAAPTAINLYAAHHFGPAAGVRFATAADNTPIEKLLSPPAITANPYLRGKTKADVVANWVKRGGRPVDPSQEPQEAPLVTPGDAAAVSVAGAGMVASRIGKDDLTRAADLLSEGASKEDVYSKTGVWHGSQGPVRMLSDVGAFAQEGSGTLKDVLEHKAVYSVYPELKDIPANLKIDPDAPPGGAGQTGMLKGKVVSIEATGRTLEEARSALLHETQHAVQVLDGRQGGGDPQDYEMLKDYSREAYSRETRMRLAMAGEALGSAAPKAGVQVPLMDPKLAAKQGLDEAWEIKALEGLSEGIVTSHTEAALDNLQKDIKTAGRPLPKAFTDALDEARAAVAAAAKEREILSPYEVYRRLYGEAESRATQLHANKTQAQLKGVNPEAFDVPEGLLVRLGRLFSRM